MKIFVTGGTGFVGGYLARRLAEGGHEVSIVTRSAGRAPFVARGVSFIQGDPCFPGPWQQRVPEHDMVINLAGRSIFARWNEKTKQDIINSRVLTTRRVVEALRQNREEKLLISGSAVGYYGSRKDDAALDEGSAPGTDFLAEVGKRWEAEALQAENYGVRVVLARLGIVLGQGGGALEKMIPAFSRWLGSPLGSGSQWFSWIHLEDILRIVVFVMNNRQLSGPVNFTAPNPVTNRELTKAVAGALEKPLFLPSVPGFLLRSILGEFGSVLLDGQRVIPKRLLDEYFAFRFPTLDVALKDLLHSES
jgi:uncharacterized protein